MEEKQATRRGKTEPADSPQETHDESREESTQAKTPPNPVDALKQRHQDTEDRLEAEAEVRKQQADEAQQRRDAALDREKEMRR